MTNVCDNQFKFDNTYAFNIISNSPPILPMPASILPTLYVDLIDCTNYTLNFNSRTFIMGLIRRTISMLPFI